VCSRAADRGRGRAPLADPHGAVPRAPGTLEAHYAPLAKLRLMGSVQLHTALQVARARRR
jgi:L-threonylcarbamoyladenylate synthase